MHKQVLITHKLFMGEWHLKYLHNCRNFFGGGGQQPPMGHGSLIHKVSGSHSDTPQSVGLPWASDQPDGETYSCKTHNTQIRKTPIPSVGFEPPISGTERPQNQALEGANNVIDKKINYTQ
jgi:hypothetical protein